MEQRKEDISRTSAVRRGWGITGKLASAIVVSVVIAVAILFAVVYFQMSHALLDKSEALLQTTTERTLQETKAWMNRTLAMLETQRDTIEYEDMDVSDMTDYIRHTAGQNDAYPAGLYVALTDGSLYHASFVPGPDFDATAKSWYQDGLESDSFILGDVYFDEDSQSYVVGASGVLKAKDGTVRGVAAEVETLAGHMDAVSESVHNISQGAQEASRISQDVRSGLMSSKDKMQNMTEVIQRISDKSTEIHKIVKTIEDIAFQTNILALNAAVEAARAGAAGKGFAVVADEVRALAGKSSSAAKETTALLSQTVESMDEGVRAAQDTADSILKVVAHADEMNKLIDGIADYTRQQDANTAEIARGIEQISTVVQTNVATAEASAAASEELAGQAAMLRELVAKFRLQEK